MSNPEHEQFGRTISGSRWFTGKPSVTRTRVIPIQVTWNCPIDGCDGEMVENGMVWPTGDPGYHHTCNKCGFTAAVHERFPRFEYERIQDKANSRPYGGNDS
jgi:hypothetical protein